jgi:hypothetical protein
MATAATNIGTKLAEKTANDDTPAWSRVIPMAVIACVCAVLASPGSAVGPNGPVPRFAAVTAKLAEHDAGGAAESEARAVISAAVSELHGKVLVLGAASYTSLLSMPGLAIQAVPVDERPLLMPALAEASTSAGASAPLNLSVSNLSSVADESVDAVLSLSALCRVNTSAALHELRRVLKAGSPLIVYEPSLALGSTTVRRLQVQGAHRPVLHRAASLPWGSTVFAPSSSPHSPTPPTPHTLRHLRCLHPPSTRC